MNTGKVYHDSEGNEVSIWQMVNREPEWAANIIQYYEGQVAQLQKERDIAVEMLESVLNHKGCQRHIRLLRRGIGTATEDAVFLAAAEALAKIRKTK